MREVLFTGKIPITCNNEDIPWQMKCDIVKIDGDLEIRLIDTRDIFTFYVCTISPSDYYVIKREQDLIVDFDSFIPILVKLFHGVSSGRFTGYFSNDNNKFMFIEKTEFRNIIRFELVFRKPEESHYKRYLSDIISRMENDNIKLIKENNMLRDQVKVVEKERKDRMSYLEEDLKSSKMKIDGLYKENKGLTNDLYSKKNEVKELNTKIYNLEKENNKLLLEMEKIKVENVRILGIEDKAADFEKENDRLRKEIESLTVQMEKLKADSESREKSASKNEGEMKELKSHNKKLKNEIEECRKRIKIMEDRIKKLKEDNKTKSSRVKELESENQKLTKRVENAQNVYNHFYSKNVENESHYSDNESVFSIKPESPPH